MVDGWFWFAAVTGLVTGLWVGQLLIERKGRGRGRNRKQER